MRHYHYVTITTKDGKEYFYDIYIRDSKAARNEARKQLFNCYGYSEDDILYVECHKAS